VHKCILPIQYGALRERRHFSATLEPKQTIREELEDAPTGREAPEDVSKRVRRLVRKALGDPSASRKSPLAHPACARQTTQQRRENVEPYGIQRLTQASLGICAQRSMLSAGVPFARNSTDSFPMPSVIGALIGICILVRGIEFRGDWRPYQRPET